MLAREYKRTVVSRWAAVQPAEHRGTRLASLYTACHGNGMSDTAIRVDHLGKRYRIGVGETQYKTIRETISTGLTKPMRAVGSIAKRHQAHTEDDSEIWALRDVTFTVKQGEVVGVIGRNGAGKSTLMKILSRITEPTCGRAEIRGRVGSLLEVGTGFHPELTGRENIFLSGAILGMRKAEIKAKLQEIIAFSEIERFADTPVKHYSSGMYLRLAFAVAAHLETENLLVDEVLAVGDAVFQKRCLGKMRDVSREGRTVLFVSHNLGAIENLCSVSILLDHGQILIHGETREVLADYRRLSAESLAHSCTGLRHAGGDGRLIVDGIRLVDSSGEPAPWIVTNSSATFVIDFSVGRDAPLPLKNCWFELKIYDVGEALITTFSSYLTGMIVHEISRGGRMLVDVESLALTPGCYYVSAAAYTNGYLTDLVESAFELQVEDGGDWYNKTPKPAFHGRVFMKQNWRHSV